MASQTVLHPLVNESFKANRGCQRASGLQLARGYNRRRLLGGASNNRMHPTRRSAPRPTGVQSLAWFLSQHRFQADDRAARVIRAVSRTRSTRKHTSFRQR